jgi:hypothetical protein
MIYSYGTGKYPFQDRPLRDDGLRIRAETFLIIMCGCLPTLRPLYLQFFRTTGQSASSEPRHEQRVAPHEEEPDAGDLNDDNRHYRYDPKIKPSIGQYNPRPVFSRHRCVDRG